MNRLLLSRAGLLFLIAGVHGALLWAMAAPAGQPVAAPLPHPMVMAEMLPLQPARPQPVSPPAPVVQRDPVKRDPVKSEPVKRSKPAPAPPPDLPPSERAMTTPREAARPAPSPDAPVPAPTPVASAAAAPPASPPTPAPGPTTPPRFDAAYLNNPAPAYPPMARRLGEEGRVLLRVQVTPEGTAGAVRLHSSSGSPLLDEAAIAAVRKWRFTPAQQAGVAVSAWVQVPLAFRLN